MTVSIKIRILNWITSFSSFKVLSEPEIDIENLVVFFLDSGFIKLILCSVRYCFGNQNQIL